MKSANVRNFVIPNLIFIAIMQFVACASAPKVAVRPNEHMEVGWTPRTVLQSPAYAWFDSGYAAYHPQGDEIERLRRMKDSVNIVVVYGTWCSDSHRELPRFLKVMDLAGVPAGHIQLIATDRAKQLPAGIAQQYDIQLIPTFIIRYRGIEAGRIIEKTNKSMELDLVDILSPFFE